ncbi:hypothetical protein OIDMADRAFT_108896 [Oidiodendron maius Zn]|uniref:Uncharacterized protein n=1 Tax=Oidiodendron maius (strain Zn) TaxID=913774 RepID=A0A0C3I252_OIDMZ|nr:hypothetical protein OIDMADRAFT_108896 [Oidiodendron maius Zn]
MTFSHAPSYEAVCQSEDGSGESSPVIERPTRAFMYIGWLFTGILAFTTAVMALWLAGPYNLHAPVAGSFRTGFSTEFDPAKSYIGEEQKQFWGGPRWYNNGTSYHLSSPSEPKYVGPPNEEIDSAWKTLLKGRYFKVTEEEAEMTFGKPHGLYNHPNIGYLMGLDVYHSLHCVEQLRRALDRDHYFNKETKMAYPDRGHRDHCLDHIRQQLMCHADLTPIPVIWYEGHRRSFVQSDVVHTCRNWDRVQEFMDTR